DEGRSVLTEVVRLAGHRAKPPHLPEDPLVDLGALALALAIEPAALAGEVLQDRAGFEDRDGLAVRPFRVDDGGHAAVGTDGLKLRRELFARPDVHRLQF